MGNTVSQALCEDAKQEEKPQEEQPEQEDAGSADYDQRKDASDGGDDSDSSAKKPPPSPERKNVGDDEKASAKESDSAQKQTSGSAQASSRAGMSEPVSVRKYSHEEAQENHEKHQASGGNKSLGGDVPEPDDEEHIQVKTVPYDPRFPATNQARNCYTRYNEYYKCISEREEDAPECKFYQRAYRSICPSEWVEGWNTQREEGNWFGKY